MLVGTDGKALMTDEEKKKREAELAAFMDKHKTRIVQWIKTHQGEKPPIFYDEHTAVWFWGTRAGRRMAQMRTRRQFKKQLKEMSNGDKNKEADETATGGEDPGIQGEVAGSDSPERIGGTLPEPEGQDTPPA